MKIHYRILLPLVFLAAFALRLYRLGVASLWYDETVSMVLAQKDLLALTRHTAGDIHPPLYYYLLHFWGQVAGWSEFSAAFLSLFFGIVLIALVYRVARAWFNPRVALIAALLVAASPYNLGYSQEVRMYTLGAFLGLASVYLFVRMFQVSGFKFQVTRDFIAYVIASALGLYTLYYFAFLLVFENLAALVWFVRKSQSRFTFYVLRPWLFSQLALLLLFAPWLPIAFHQATDPPVPPWRTFTTLPSVLLESFSALAFGQSLDVALTLPLVLFIAVLFGLAIFGRTHHAPHITPLFLLGYTFIPLLIIFALSLWKPLYHVRYVFLYSPAFYVLWAVGFDRLFGLRIDFSKYATSLLAGSSLLIAAIGYSDYNFWFDPRYADDDLRGAVRRLVELWRPGDAVLINAGYTYTAFVYYFDQPIAWRGRITNYQLPITDSNAGALVLQTGSIGGAPNLGWGSPESDFYATTADETRAALDRVFALHQRVWILRLYDTVVDPDGIIRDYLATRGRIIFDEGFAGESFARVQGYITAQAPTSELPASATRREILLGNRIALMGFEPATMTLRAGEPLDVTLYWQAKEPTNVDAHLYIGLFAHDDKPVASSNEIPVGNALGTSRWKPGELMREPIRLRVPANVAPGNYVLRVALYNPLNNETLDTPPGQWVTEHGQIVLTSVRVEK